jgi:hypothetical protein
MAQAANVNIDISSKADTRGFKVAETALQKLNKSVKTLAGSIGIAYGTRAIVRFGKESVKAFADSEAQQARLAKLLKVTVNATQGQIALINDQAEALAKVGVVSKDNITQVQSQLATFNLQTSTIKALTPAILDYVTAEKGAAASASEFKMMTNGLAQALNGNFASLTKTGFVLDKTTKKIIKNGNEAERAAEIVKVLESTYKDFNASLRDTTSGQMQALANAAEDAREVIGKGLIDSLNAVGGGDTRDGIEQTISLMDLLAESAAKFSVNFATGIGQGLALLRGDFATFKALGEEAAKSDAQKAAYSPTSMYFTGETAERAKLIATIKKGNATEKEKNRLAAIELAKKKQEAELDDLKKKFDTDRINLETALANSKDEAEKARIRSLLTIMDEDAKSAAKRLYDLDAANIAKMKSELAAAESLRYLAEQAAKAGAGLSTIGNPGGVYNYTPSAPSFVYGANSMPDYIPPSISNMPEAGNPQGIYDYSPSSPSFTYSPPQVNNITINTPVGTEDYLTEAMQRALQKLNRYGDSTTFAGAL